MKSAATPAITPIVARPMWSSCATRSLVPARMLRQKLGPTAHFSFPFGLPQNISAPAVEIACASYRNVFSAYRGGNFHADARRILKRVSFPHTLWELELQLQSVLTGEAKEPPHLKVRIDEVSQDEPS